MSNDFSELQCDHNRATESNTGWIWPDTNWAWSISSLKQEEAPLQVRSSARSPAPGFDHVQQSLNMPLDAAQPPEPDYPYPDNSIPTDEYPEDFPPPPPSSIEPESGAPISIIVTAIPRKAYGVKRRPRRHVTTDAPYLRRLVLKKMACIRHAEAQEKAAADPFECLHGVEMLVEEEVGGLESLLVEYCEGEEIQEYDGEPAACDSMVF